MALTVDELLLHMGIDERDAQIIANATSALDDAEAYLRSAIGDDVFELLPDDPKLTRLWKVYAQDMYDERSTSAKAGSAKRDMVHSMEWQLRMELARAREGADV